MLITRIGSSYATSDFPEQFSNQIYFSIDSNLSDYTYQSSYSIKYVQSGKETYIVNGRRQEINSKQFLLVNNQSEVTTVKGMGKALSIFIDPSTILDVWRMHQSKTVAHLLDNHFSGEGMPFYVHEAVFTSNHQAFAKTLGQLAHQIMFNDLPTIQGEVNPSLFFSLSEVLIHDHGQDAVRLNQLKSIKISTLQEQYSRLIRGYEYLTDNWNSPFSLNQTAAEAMLSPYHFHRLFKACYNTTPYRYHLSLQMKKAHQFIKLGQYSISETAMLCGFQSLTAFGRAFKKYFGTTPSSVK